MIYSICPLGTYSLKVRLYNLIVGLLTVLCFFGALPVGFAESNALIQIIGSDSSCSSYTVKYKIIAPPGSYVGSLKIYGPSGLIATTDAPTGIGEEQTANVMFTAQPQYTELSAVISISSSGSPVAEASTSVEPCYGDSGDNRLNPDSSEYYAVYCNFDRIDVYREIPELFFVKLISLADVLGLTIGGCMDLGDLMTICRTAEDELTIYGSNGNAAPTPGSKSFSLNECIDRNGGPPQVPTPKPQPTPNTDPSPPTSEDEALCRVLCTFESDAICWILCTDYCDQLEDQVEDSAIAPSFLAANSKINLDVFYAVRDQVLASSNEGQRYIDLYETYNLKILRLMVIYPELWEMGEALILRFQPLLQLLVEGQGSKAEISAADVDTLKKFLDKLASVAGPDLAGVIATERARTPLDQFTGMTMAAAESSLIGCLSHIDPLPRIDCALAELLDPHVCDDITLQHKVKNTLKKPVKRARHFVSNAFSQTSAKKFKRMVRKAKLQLRKINKRLKGKKKFSQACNKDIKKMVTERRQLLSAL